MWFWWIFPLVNIVSSCVWFCLWKKSLNSQFRKIFVIFCVELRSWWRYTYFFQFRDGHRGKKGGAYHTWTNNGAAREDRQEQNHIQRLELRKWQIRMHFTDGRFSLLFLVTSRKDSLEPYLESLKGRRGGNKCWKRSRDGLGGKQRAVLASLHHLRLDLLNSLSFLLVLLRIRALELVILMHVLFFLVIDLITYVRKWSGIRFFFFFFLSCYCVDCCESCFS